MLSSYYPDLTSTSPEMAKVGRCPVLRIRVNVGFNGSSITWLGTYERLSFLQHSTTYRKTAGGGGQRVEKRVGRIEEEGRSRDDRCGRTDDGGKKSNAERG